MFCASFLPLPPALGIDGEHRWAGNSRSFCKILKGTEEEGHFQQWNEDDAAEPGWLPGRTDASCIPCLAHEPAHWQLPTLFIQPAQHSTGTAHRALTLHLTLLGFCRAGFHACVWEVCSPVSVAQILKLSVM